MTPMIARLALEWLRAEHAARLAKGEESAAFVATDDDENPELLIAADRVYEVLAGEVRWSNCSPGDRAIWKGRMRDVERFEQIWRNDPGPQRLVNEQATRDQAADERAQANYPGVGGRMPNRDAVTSYPPTQRRSRHWMNWYDTLRCHHRMARDSDLFSGGNNGFWTNVKDVRMLNDSLRSTVVIVAFYASLPTLDGLRWAADNVLVTFQRGETSCTPPMFVRDLFLGVVPLEPIVIPVRQTFFPRIVVRNVDQLELEREQRTTQYRRAARPSRDELRVEPFDLTIHCEGVVVSNYL